MSLALSPVLHRALLARKHLLPIQAGVDVVIHSLRHMRTVLVGARSYHRNFRILCRNGIRYYKNVVVCPFHGGDESGFAKELVRHVYSCSQQNCSTALQPYGGGICQKQKETI